MKKEEARATDLGGLERMQFSLGAMLLGVAVVAATLAAFVQLGILGAVLFWCAAAVFTLFTWSWRSPAMAATRTMLWGVVLPLVCLYFDPGLLQKELYSKESLSPLASPDWSFAQWQPWNLLIYGMLLYQMLVLALWTFLGKRLGGWAGFISGTLWPGLLLAAVLGLALLEAAFFGLVFAGVGLLALTPIFTAVVLNRARLQAKAQSFELQRRRARWTSWLVGIFMAIGLPAFVLAGFSLLRPAPPAPPLPPWPRITF